LLWASNAASASGTSWVGTAMTHACPAAVSRILWNSCSLTQKRSAPVISSTASTTIGPFSGSAAR
jgi:hypothetical protein